MDNRTRKAYLRYLLSQFRARGGHDVHDIGVVTIPLIQPLGDRPKWLYFQFEGEKIWNSRHIEYALELEKKGLLVRRSDIKFQVLFTVAGYELATRRLPSGRAMTLAGLLCTLGGLLFEYLKD